MTGNKCKGWSSGGFVGHSCNQDLKTDEQIKAGLCGRHLAGKRRREANDKTHREERTRDNEFLAKAQATVARLAKLGVEAAPHYSARSSCYTGRVVIEDGEALAVLLEEKQ